jgi:hypothetical protein
MIRDRALWEEFERNLALADRPDYRRNLRIFEALYQEACALGALPPKDRLEGIEHDIRLARVLHA